MGEDWTLQCGDLRRLQLDRKAECSTCEATAPRVPGVTQGLAGFFPGVILGLKATGTGSTCHHGGHQVNGPN